MQTITTTWGGQAIEFKPTNALYMRIEEGIDGNAFRFERFAFGGVSSPPISHIAWVVYCCLRHAGADVRTPDDVRHALVQDPKLLGAQGMMVAQLINAYFSAQPQKAPVKKKEPEAETLPPSSRKSKSSTGSPSGSGGSSPPSSGG